MKRLITFTIFSLLLLPATAQRINAYVTAGTITSQVEGDELKGFAHWGFHGGVGAWVNLDERDCWAMSIETDYSCRGIFNKRYSHENLYNIDMNLHYVDIPLTFFFRDPYGGLRIGAGLVYSRLVSQPHGTIDYRPKYFVPDTSNMAFLKNDLAAAIEARFNIWQGLLFSARFQYSLIPVKRDWHFQYEGNEWSNNCYNSSLIFRLIWQFGYQDSFSHSKRTKDRRR